MSATDQTSSLVRVLQAATVSQITTTVVLLLIVRFIVRGIFRVYFHPLSRFPGPKLSAFTRLPTHRATWKGNMHHYVGKIHREYGDIVRISPDELSIIDPGAWKDVQGHPTKNTKGSMPSKHFARYGRPLNGEVGMISARDDSHARQRRIFNPAFSDRALKQQTPLFTKYIDKLVQKLKEGLEEDPDRKWDMVRMYNYTTFDVMADLTFGAPLHMLDNGDYDPWVKLIFASIKMGTRISILTHYPLLFRQFKRFVPQTVNKKRVQHARFAVDRVTKRLEQGRETEGVDVWDLVLAQEDGKGLTRGEMDSNAGLFMIAGTETTATLVSGLTYLLLQNPECMKKLLAEIRDSFATVEDISMESIAALPYLNACIKEALRLYPPVPVGLPRLTPPDGSTVCGQYIPPNTALTMPHLAMYTSPRNFKDPLSFVPGRWMGDERYADDRREAWQPFSYGSRDCLGKNMANHEMRLMVAKVLYTFDFELCPESENWKDQAVFNLWEKHPLFCKLKLA
ncbi:cytochrome P450 [Amniculicola lignicola CBS 123094]|uniref:Cytochrome P450 n=1 Tax=Amniculicola lignicola CBS 123094 TaxID=1392246 RepID=A0A6A5X2X2_9PLEO|nr:cytochrome P450 [Amniculicola lignicola CBS 123094]